MACFPATATKPRLPRHTSFATLHLIVFAMSLALALVSSPADSVRADALERLKLERLKTVREAVTALGSERQEIRRSGPYQEYRAAIHLHSAFSHDSRGTIEEIVAAAKATGTQVLMFTEHTSDQYDPAVNGHHGMKDGVLLIPGVETNGFLVFPTESLKGVKGQSPQGFADQARAKGSLLFLSHVEERMEWEVAGLTGAEIYNTHADSKDEKNLLAALQNPLWIFQSIELFQKYPQEAFASLADYPADYLKKWDELCKETPHTGIGANDSHQNIGLVARLIDGGKVRLEDALGEKLLEANLLLLPMFKPLTEGKKAGDTLFEFRLDPYQSSLRHVGTHLLMTELSEAAVREALQAGRAYVSFDWIADPTGFDFAVLADSNRYEMGSQLDYSDGLLFRAEAPLPVQWRLLRNGAVVAESEGRSLQRPVAEPGNYRVEAWIEVAGEQQVWILSNPIYLRAR